MSAKAVDSLLSMEAKGILYGGNIGAYRERLDELSLDDGNDAPLPEWALRVLCETIPVKDRVRIVLFHHNDCAAREGKSEAVVDTFLMKDGKRELEVLRKAQAEGRLKPPVVTSPRKKSKAAEAAEKAAKRNAHAAQAKPDGGSGNEWAAL